jgi:hypothetical protein
MPANLVEQQGSCFYRFHRSAQSYADASKVIEDFIHDIIAHPGTQQPPRTIPSSAPLIPELAKLRIGTDMYSVLEYVAEMAKMGFPVTSTEVGALVGTEPKVAGVILRKLMNDFDLAQQFKAQMVNFPASTKAATNPTVEAIFWTLKSANMVPIVITSPKSVTAQYNALRRACLDLATQSDLLQRWGRVLGEIEWATYTGSSTHAEFINNRILKVQADFTQALFTYLTSDPLAGGLQQSRTWHI